MSRKATMLALVCLGSVLVATIALATGGLGAQTSTLTRSAPASSPLATAVPPEWTFAIHQFEDPYEGEMREDPIAGARVVGAEIEITNASSQSLTVYLNNIRLRTDVNTTYPGGIVVGAPAPDPPGDRLTSRLVEGVVEPGEAARGWVWWEVPEGETLVEVVFYPSPPPPSIIPLPIASLITAG